MKYTLIGSGSLCHHLQFYFSETALPVNYWSRNSSPQFNTFKNIEDNESRLRKTISETDVVLIAIKDDEIESFIKGHPELDSKTLVHFSGALSTPLANSAHPLMTFGKELYSTEDYKKILFVTEQGQLRFESLFPNLPNQSITIPKDQKTLYHALCATLGNLSQILWNESYKLFEKNFDINGEHLDGYLEQNLKNFMSQREQALTGPLKRNDNKTLDLHEQALAGSPLEDVYKKFRSTYQNKGQNKGQVHEPC